MAETKTSKDNFVWIDLEMSGLDPDREVIIEIATIVTDCNLNILEEGPDLVIHQPEIYLTRMDDWNKNQHSKSGLIDDVRHFPEVWPLADTHWLKIPTQGQVSQYIVRVVEFGNHIGRVCIKAQGMTAERRRGDGKADGRALPDV